MEKKVIYGVYEDIGIYEERYQKILKAFFDKNKAEEFMEKKEKELEETENQYKKYCSKCQLYKGLIPAGCKKYEIDEYNECINEIDGYYLGHISYYIEEIEVE